MWQILLISICLTSFKLIVAEELKHGQVTGILKFSPAVRTSLPNYQPAINYPTGNLGEKTFEVPLTYDKLTNRFEGSQISSNNCPQLEMLENILVLLKRLLKQNDNEYVLQPAKRIQILQSLNEYLQKPGSVVSEVDNGLKLKELIARTDKALLIENNASSQSISDVNKKNHEASLIFKYDIPAINNIGCKEALAALIKTVKNAHLQMINYCNQSGKCQFTSELDPLNIQHSDNSDTVLALSVPTQTKMPHSNPSLSNIYDVGNSINVGYKANNQVLNQMSSNDFSNSRIQSDLNVDRFLTNNREKKLNINLNHEASQSNVQFRDNSKVLNSLLTLHNPVPTQVQETPANRNPWNTYNVQKPNNLVIMPQDQGDLTQRVSNGYLNFLMKPQSYSDTNNFLSNSALNTNVVQTKNKQTEILDITNNRYFNVLKNNDVKSVINTPTIENNEYNAIPLLQTQDVQRYLQPHYINDRNQQLYKVSKLVNDKSASMAMLNQNNHNIKEQIQFKGASLPDHEFNNLNYPSYIKSNENQNIGQVSPMFYSNLNTKQIPYLSSINLNHQNSLNYNSQKAELGLNVHTPQNVRDYPKHEIYGNILFDSNRFASAPNLVKLNSVADNDEIVELTYKLKRAHSISYSPYYYIKFKMPYKDFVSKIIDFSKNPYIRSNPLKIHQELLAVSNLSEASPDIKNIQPDEASKLILNNGGVLVNAEIMGAKDSDAKEYLKTIQNLNGNLNTNNILNFVKNYKTFSPSSPLTSSLDSGFTVFRPEENHDDILPHQTNNPQSIHNEVPRRFFSSVPHYGANTISLAFLPAKVASPVPVPILLNPLNPITV